MYDMIYSQEPFRSRPAQGRGAGRGEACKQGKAAKKRSRHARLSVDSALLSVRTFIKQLNVYSRRRQNKPLFIVY